MDFYIDSFFMINFLMNFAILYICAWLVRRRPIYFRLLIAAAIGSIYACYYFLVGFDSEFLSAVSKIAVSLVMLIVAFKYYGIKKMLETFVAFFGSGFLVAGTVLGLMFVFAIPGEVDNGIINWQINSSAFDLIVAVLTVFIIVKALIDIFRRKHIDDKLKAKIVVDISGRQVECDGLMDTGNDLRDPVSGNAIVILEYLKVKGLFDEKSQKILDKKPEDLISCMTEINDEDIKKRICIIPFSSIGNENGLLPGIRVDKLLISFEGKWSCLENAVVCFASQKLSASGEFSAIINPEIIKSLKRIGGDQSVLKKTS